MSFLMGTKLPLIAIFNNVGGQIEKPRMVWEVLAGEAVRQGVERGGVMLPEFEAARRSEGGGGYLWATASFADLHLFGLCVWGLGLWVCGFVFSVLRCCVQIAPDSSR